MRIYKFFTLCFLMLVLEVLLFDIATHPTISLVKICALAALMLGDLPWYGQGYLLMMVSISSFVQGFPLVFDVIGFGSLIVIASVFRTTMVQNLALQSAIVAVLALVFMAIDCFSCLTISNFCVTILITPFMLKFLR